MEYSLQNRYLYPFSYSIFIIQNKNPGCVLFRFFGRHNGIRHNDDFIAGRDQPGLLPGIGFADRRSGSRSAKDFFARTLEAGDGMGGESWRGG